MALSAGTRLGPYEILAPLGAGGMGEVYRARDTKLGRDVAIKVLPPSFADDPDRVARFQREARVLASLNHSHIAAIYGLEEAAGVRALVLEFVEGDTLLNRIRRGPLPIADALTLACQIAAALDAAHERGIVHRDIKPANIALTQSSMVKVLDFGLARDRDPSSPDLTHSPTVMTHETRDGVLVGTAAYMSPEQARGGAVDKRTDVWAFGCVLYEMLTGRVAFGRPTVSDTIAAVIEREPDWQALPPSVPSSIVRLLRRCLQKDPQQRFRDIGDVRILIDEVLAALAAGGGAEQDEAIAAARPVAASLAWKLAIAVIVVLGMAGVAFGLWPRPSSGDTWVNPLANARFTRFTDFPGSETLGTISPDGKFVAFQSDRDGQFNLWLSQVGTGRFANLTKDIPALIPNYQVAQAGFSGDGTEVWFNTGGRKALMPFIGGTPRPFLGPGAQHPAWSPDGTQMVYFNAADGDPMFVADRTGANARPISADKKGMHNHNPVWSTDGQWIYFVHGTDTADHMDVWRVRPSGGAAERLTEHHASVNFLAPLDARTLLFTAPAEDRSGPWLWALDVERKTSHRVSSGLEQYTSVAASADGRRVVATVANPSANLWSVPLLDRPAEERDEKPYPMPTVRALAPRFAGTSLFYLSAHGAGDGLWRLQDGQSSELWKGSDGALAEPPAVSRDARRVAIVLRKDGKRQLTIMSADGSESRSLAASIDVQGAADWAPDGNSIVTGGSDEQGPGLFKIPVDSVSGGAPVRLTKGAATNPVWSSDGRLIVYAGASVAAVQQLAAVRPDGTAVELPPIRVPTSSQQGFRFMPSGKALVFLQAQGDAAGGSSSQDFWLFDLATKATRQLTRLAHSDQVGAFDITPDGKEIVFGRLRENSDIVLIDLPR